ncbi:cell division protein FtsQ/DivIB [Notoacmeibacter sp. MSK16QG-6]|uniref:cell division protein FtsQ/DivIB n=1 Tax=Notoacmeibacter sp. MSK16QG-6 TaxID=2957982 RepID=UPI0020A038DC|nr:cell division protein FtsQ/DivIB [Notoacmeibacter sp. MSK16QG-6]MCP1199698.1 FtsQ-type POTRA domain-containing protein [Notoacmeibacter sp. MSK16QG-6]
MRTLTDRLSLPRDFGVLPKPLRRPVRFCRRFMLGQIAVPDAATPLIVGGFFASWIVAGAVMGGHMPVVTGAVAKATGFGVAELAVAGNRFTDETTIAKAVGLDDGRALLGLNAEDARHAIVALPWIKSAEVKKAYPSRLSVDLVEHKPAALWQVGSLVQVIDRSGMVIAPYEGVVLSGLPLVVGDGAAEHARQISDLVAAYPTVKDRVRAFIRVGHRRWDLQLDNGMTVKLPERRAAEALARLEEGNLFAELVARDVSSIDMRIEGQLVVATSDAVMDARRKSFETIEKKLRHSLVEGRT